MVEAGGATTEEQRQSLLTELEKTFQKQLKEPEAGAITDFARVFFAHFPLQDWPDRSLSDIHGCCYTLWHQLKTPHAELPSVQVFNPTLEEHGWLCGRTVVAVLQRDMPFIVDSIRLKLNRRGVPVQVLKSTVLHVGRDRNGTPCAIRGGGEHPQSTGNVAYAKEALLYLEINLHASEEELAALRRAVRTVLSDVETVVDDFDNILRSVSRLGQNLSCASEEPGRLQEVRDFLQWLTDSHFTFLGYREFDYVGEGSERRLRENLDARLGIFRKRGAEPAEVGISDFNRGMNRFYESDELLAFSKGGTRSHVHRAVYPDYVVVKRYDKEGNVCGEGRLLGLFTYSVYRLTPTQIPIVREKVASIIARSKLDPDSHDGKNLRRAIENFPRDELFQASVDELYETILGVANINERHVVRLFMRKDPFGKFVTCLAYIPRDVYTTEIRLKIERIIGDAIGSRELDSTSYFSESVLARAQLIFRVESTEDLHYDVHDLQAQVVSITRSWQDHLEQAFVELLGEGPGLERYRVYKNAFSSGYQESFDARVAVRDVAMLAQLGEGRDIGMNFYQSLAADRDLMHFRVVRLEHPIELSQVVPMLEHLGLRVLGEHPYRIRPADGRCIWLHDFELRFGLPVSVDVHAVRHLFQDAFAAIWRGETESDAFNRLVLGARLNWREVALLRTFSAYMKQTNFNFSQDYIADTLAHHLNITRNLVALFKAYFNPRLSAKAEVDGTSGNRRAERLERKVLNALEKVPNLNEDRILRHYLELIRATLRTNFFQSSANAPYKNYISLKFNPAQLPDIPLPRPEYEIFVYSPRVEGVHLRGGKVARGGLRWSDRLQDYRTEVLGLMKAQQVKNAVIVPTGAKGGFVPKQLPAAGRDEQQQEAIACYKIFIQGLLDLTDNVQEGRVLPPPDVVRRDDDDPYLVVAADKGTATFSDIANEISLAYDHWLGDAFASGGSQGYDHKRMGITARGAWVSVERHFRERGVDVQKEDFTVVGIGDMSGDVFGNGMLLSQHICLQAAFNHLHVFIDPKPDPGRSFAERKRLSELPRSSWEDYNTELISAGGGIFSRAAKSIAITPEMKEAFAIEADQLTPNELIRALLVAPVDLLWNGGIGTYVKASSESHAQVGDKSNDAVRVDGRDLRCKVIGEGGNLGVTQLGRIEFALNGGSCNTDFIDNAAGVDCSDHEVNIKILLDDLVSDGEMTLKQRNKLLAEMTEEVADLVLQNNYRQTQAISVACFQASQRAVEYRRFISHLENSGQLNRDLEFLPDDESLAERNAQDKHLTRPELSVLISYSKVMLKEQLAATDVARDPYLASFVRTAFPVQVQERFPEQLQQHKLLNEIVSTQVANDLINNLGITGSHRLLETTGASVEDIAKAYVTSRDVFQLEPFNDYIRSLGAEVSAELQSELMINMIRRVRRGARWFLRNRRGGLDPRRDIANFAEAVQQVNGSLGEVLEGAARDQWLACCERLRSQGVPEHWVVKLAMPANLFSGLGVVEAARLSGAELGAICRLNFALQEKLQLNWFASQISEAKVDSYWQALARESLIDDLEAQLRNLSVSIVKRAAGSDLDEALDAWAAQFEGFIGRWRGMVTEVQAAPGTDFAMFSVALRELIDLAQATAYRHDGSGALPE